MSRNHKQEDNLTIIGSASSQMLLASENAAYFEFFQDNMRLKAELNAKMYVLTKYMSQAQMCLQVNLSPI
jgi:hypothetical protein